MLKAKLNELTVEEFANTITHGFGLLLSVAGFIFLVVMAGIRGDFWYLTSSILYGLSLVILYAASTVYHGATSPKQKKILQLVDHCCIYVLIAGSYTPFTLIVLREGIGQRLFVFIWVFALLGILSKVFFGRRFPILSVLSYLVMGWIGVIVVQPLFAALGFAPIALVIAGGVAYSLGVIFFAWHSIRHHHAIWHLFVLSGSILHFLAVAIYVLPYQVKA
ncbi:MAG: hemolysin III family protein [Acidobacteria bacterium]|nr:hemolysin III family protein [Acidobacteriota bacterium]